MGGAPVPHHRESCNWQFLPMETAGFTDDDPVNPVHDSFQIDPFEPFFPRDKHSALPPAPPVTYC